MSAEIMASSDPREQKALGRKVRNFEVDTWNKKCREIVKMGNMAKVRALASIIFSVFLLYSSLRMMVSEER